MQICKSWEFCIYGYKVSLNIDFSWIFFMNYRVLQTVGIYNILIYSPVQCFVFHKLSTFHLQWSQTHFGCSRSCSWCGEQNEAHLGDWRWHILCSPDICRHIQARNLQSNLKLRLRAVALLYSQKIEGKASIEEIDYAENFLTQHLLTMTTN
jgi:hypothetical protein